MTTSLINLLLPLVFEFAHTPSQQAYDGEPVSIHITISEEVVKAHLLIEETSIRMEKDKHVLSATIPGELVSSPYVRYHIVAKTRDDQTIESPEYKVTVVEKEGLIELVAPEPYGSVTDKRPDIALIFNAEIEPSAATIRLDGTNITEDCEVTRYSVYCKPQTDFSVGEHTLEVAIKNVATETFTFSVVSSKYAHGYVGLGLRYVDCDTVSDYLPYEPGFIVPFDVYASGVFFLPFHLWVYHEETTDFSLELETPVAKVSLGDVYPAGSELTLHMVTPRGIQISTTSLPLDVELVAGEIEHVDTSFCVDTLIDTLLIDSFIVEIDTLVDTTVSGNYTRYMLGGRSSWELGSLKLGVSYVYGTDDSNSLDIDSSLFQTGLIELPLRNTIIAGEVEYSILKNLSVGFEYSTSRTRNIPSYSFHESTSQDTIGDAYSVSAELETGLLDVHLSYSDIDKSYYTVGNPYLDAGKEGVLGEFMSSWKSIYYNGTYERYEADDTTGYYLYSSVSYTIWRLSPYVIHSLIGNSAAYTLGSQFSFGRGALSLSYGLGETSNSLRADCTCEIFRNWLSLRGGYGESRSLDSLGTVAILTQNPEFEIEVADMVSLEYRGIYNRDNSSDGCSYEENIFTLRLRKKF
jgi:hypothetical protein